MRLARILGLICSAALAFPAGVAASPEATAATEERRTTNVALRFDWPRDLTADVEFAQARTQTGQAPSGGRVRGKLAVRGRGSGIAARYHGWAGTGADGAALLRASEELVIVAGADGRSVEVEGVAAAAESFGRIPPFSDPSPQMQKVRALAPAILEKGVRESWAMLVGFWAGNDLELGQAYESDSVVPVPAVPGATLRLKVDVRAVRRAACPGRPDRACVELWMRSRPDPEDASRLVHALAERVGAAQAGAAGDLTTVTEVTLLTEPSTLTPHRLEIRKSSEMTAPDGIRKISRVDSQIWTYAYPAAAKGKP